MQDCQKQMELSWVIIAPVLTGCVGGDFQKKNTTAFKNLALSTTQQFLVMTGKAKHCSTHGEQFMMTARLMTVPGNNFEAGRPLDDSKSTWQ